MHIGWFKTDREVYFLLMKKKAYTEYLIYSFIAANIIDDTKPFITSTRTIAKEFGISFKQVHRYLLDLVQNNVIKIETMTSGTAVSLVSRCNKREIPNDTRKTHEKTHEVTHEKTHKMFQPEHDEKEIKTASYEDSENENVPENDTPKDPVNDTLHVQKVSHETGVLVRIKEKNNNTSSYSSKSQNENLDPKIGPIDIAKKWNQTLPIHSQVNLDLLLKNEKRLKKVRSVLKAMGHEIIYKAIDEIPNSTFLCGMNDRGWKPDFGWICDPENITRVLEGKYKDQNLSSAKQPKSRILQ